MRNKRVMRTEYVILWYGRSNEDMPLIQVKRIVRDSLAMAVMLVRDAEQMKYYRI